MARTRRCWLVKSEPGTYSIDDLRRDGATFWSGIRNYQARNFLRDDVRRGDEVLFYHSSASPPGVAGLARVASDARPDETALDPDSAGYDPKASADEPRWYGVDIAFVERFGEIVPLARLRRTPGLEDMLVARNSRLSVQPVTPAEFEIVRALGREGK